MESPYYRPLKQTRQISSENDRDYTVVTDKVYVPIDVFPDVK